MFTPDADCDRLADRGFWNSDVRRRRCTPPIGPENAYSNAAYGLAGLFVLWQDWSDRGFVMAMCLGVLCWGSWVYHSRKTKPANRFDRVGMLMVFGGLNVLAIDAADPRIAGAMWVGALIVAVVFAYKLPDTNLDVLMGLFLAQAMIAAWLKGSVPLGALSMGLFLVGYGIWTADRKAGEAYAAWIHRDQSDPATKALPEPPDSPFGMWGHALWHVLTAAAIATMHLAVVTA